MVIGFEKKCCGAGGPGFVAGGRGPRLLGATAGPGERICAAPPKEGGREPFSRVKKTGSAGVGAGWGHLGPLSPLDPLVFCEGKEEKTGLWPGNPPPGAFQPKVWAGIGGLGAPGK